MSQKPGKPSPPSQSNREFVSVAKLPASGEESFTVLTPRTPDVIFPNPLAPPRGVTVFITTATKQDVHALTVNWMLSPWLRFMSNVVFDVIPDPKGLQHARNSSVLRFYETGCSHFFVLDSDCRPVDGTIRRLVEYDLPIVAAPHRTIKGNEIGVVVLDRAPDGYRQHRPWTGLQGPNVVVGCAGLMIKREVFDQIGPPWFENHYDEKGLLTKSEDFDFCDKAYAAGIEVWADCDLTQTHLLNWML